MHLHRSKIKVERLLPTHGAMENKPQYSTALWDFTSFMYSRGYREKFTITLEGTGMPKRMGDLSYCLEHYLSVMESGSSVNPRMGFILETYAPFRSGKDNIQCTFKIEFDTVMGFKVKALVVKEAKSRQTRSYRFEHNNQVPGALILEGLFPKKKPWDDFLKGKFRP